MRACAKTNRYLGLIFQVSHFIRQSAALKVLILLLFDIISSSPQWLPHQRYLVERINEIETIFLRMEGLRLNYHFIDVPVNTVAAQLHPLSSKLWRDLASCSSLWYKVHTFFRQKTRRAAYELSSTMARIRRKAKLNLLIMLEVEARLFRLLL